MSMQDDSFLQCPRETIQLLLIGIFCLWHSLVGLLSFLFFLVLIRGLRVQIWQLLIVGTLLAVICSFLIELEADFKLSTTELIHNSFVSHIAFWRGFFNQGLRVSLALAYQQAFYYLLGFPLFFASLLGMTE